MSLTVILNQTREHETANVNFNAFNQHDLQFNNAFELNVLSSLFSNPCQSFAFWCRHKIARDDDGLPLLMSPVYINTGHNDSMITASMHASELKSDEQSLLRDHLQRFLLEDKIKLAQYSPNHFLLLHKKHANLQSKPLQQVMNSSLLPFLVDYQTETYWLTLFTEIQMLLASEFSHNAINGVWLWGGHEPIRKTPIECVMSDDELIQSFLIAYGIKVVPFNENALEPSISHIILSSATNNQLNIIKRFAINQQTRWLWNNANIVENKKNYLKRLVNKWIHHDNK